MRKNITRSASTVDWSLPDSVVGWEHDASAYQFNWLAFPPSTAGPLANTLTAINTGGQDVMRMQGVPDTDGEEIFYIATYNLDEGNIVVAPGRTYRLTGHVDLRPSLEADSWDAESWTVALYGFPEDEQTGTPVVLVNKAYPKTVDETTVTVDDFDETFVMPTNIRSFRIDCNYMSDDRGNPATVFTAKMDWRDFLLEIT